MKETLTWKEPLMSVKGHEQLFLNEGAPRAS